MYGPYCASGTDLMDLPCHVAYNLDLEVSAMKQGTAIRVLKAAITQLNHRRRNNGNHAERITDMTRVVSATSSTDPRDKVYGLLSLLSYGMQSMIRVDYQLPLASVYAEATFAAIVDSGTFGIMALVSPQSSNSHSLPLWVFDFTNSEPPQELVQRKIKSNVTQQIRPMLDSPVPVVGFNSSLCHLTMAGVLLDTVIDHLRLHYREHIDRPRGCCGLHTRDAESVAALAAARDAAKRRVAEQRRLGWWPQIALRTSDRAGRHAHLKSKLEDAAVSDHAPQHAASNLLASSFHFSSRVIKHLWVLTRCSLGQCVYPEKAQ